MPTSAADGSHSAGTRNRGSASGRHETRPTIRHPGTSLTVVGVETLCANGSEPNPGGCSAMSTKVRVTIVVSRNRIAPLPPSGVPCAATAAAPNAAAVDSAVAVPIISSGAAVRALRGGVRARAVPGTTRPWSNQNTVATTPWTNDSVISREKKYIHLMQYISITLK